LQRRRFDQRRRNFRLWLFADEWLAGICIRGGGFQHKIGKMQVIAVRRIGKSSAPAFALDLAFQIGSDPESSRLDLMRSGRSLLLRSHDAGAGAPVTILDSNVTGIIWPRIALDRVRKAEQPELCLRLLSIQDSICSHLLLDCGCSASAATCELRDQRDDPDCEEQPNPSADGVYTYKPQNPQHKENYRQCPQHICSYLLALINKKRGRRSSLSLEAPEPLQLQ